MTLTCGSCGREHEFLRGDHTVAHGLEPEWDTFQIMTRVDSHRTVETKVAVCSKCGYRTWIGDDTTPRLITESSEEINQVDLFYQISEKSELGKMRKLST